MFRVAICNYIQIKWNITAYPFPILNVGIIEPLLLNYAFEEKYNQQNPAVELTYSCVTLIILSGYSARLQCEVVCYIPEIH